MSVERHGNSMGTAWYVWIDLYWATSRQVGKTKRNSASGGEEIFSTPPCQTGSGVRPASWWRKYGKSETCHHKYQNLPPVLQCRLVGNYVICTRGSEFFKNLEAAAKLSAPDGWHEVGSILRTHSWEWPVNFTLIRRSVLGTRKRMHIFVCKSNAIIWRRY